MATQIGLLRITGTVGGICFYRTGGLYYARQKSSLTKNRVMKDPAFAETMRYAGRMEKASKIASERYKAVPKKERSREKYRELVGIVIRELAGAEAAIQTSERYTSFRTPGHGWTQINTDKYNLKLCEWNSVQPSKIIKHDVFVRSEYNEDKIRSIQFSFRASTMAG